MNAIMPTNSATEINKTSYTVSKCTQRKVENLIGPHLINTLNRLQKAFP